MLHGFSPYCLVLLIEKSIHTLMYFERHATRGTGTHNLFFNNEKHEKARKFYRIVVSTDRWMRICNLVCCVHLGCVDCKWVFGNIARNSFLLCVQIFLRRLLTVKRPFFRMCRYSDFSAASGRLGDFLPKTISGMSLSGTMGRSIRNYNGGRT